MRPDTLKLLKKNTGKTPQVIVNARDFQSKTPVAYKIILKPDKCDSMKLRSFYTAKETSPE